MEGGGGSAKFQVGQSLCIVWNLTGSHLEYGSISAGLWWVLKPVTAFSLETALAVFLA